MKRTYIDGNIQILKDVLERSGYFDDVTLAESVTIDTNLYRYMLTCTMSSGEHTATLRIGYLYASAHSDSYAVFYDNSNGISEEWNNAQASSYPDVRARLCPTYAYQCSGGLAVLMQKARMVITKNNRGETVVVLTTGGLNQTSGTSFALATAAAQITAYAPSDVKPVMSYITNTTIGNQTVLLPICTSSDMNVVSCTETAFWMAYKQYDVTAQFQYSGQRYFTDGYFAIEDKEGSE